MASRGNVRAAIAAYLSSPNANIPYLAHVYQHPAKFTPEGEFFDGQDPGHQTGAVIFLYIGRQMEHRIALGGPHNGRKAVEYELVLDCFIRSTSPQAEDAGTAADDFLDALVAWIRADRNAGNPALIFQWGEGANPGGPDIEIEALYPRSIRGSQQVTQTYASLRTTVVEIVQS